MLGHVMDKWCEGNIYGCPSLTGKELCLPSPDSYSPLAVKPLNNQSLCMTMQSILASRKEVQDILTVNIFQINRQQMVLQSLIL